MSFGAPRQFTGVPIGPFLSTASGNEASESKPFPVPGSPAQSIEPKEARAKEWRALPAPKWEGALPRTRCEIGREGEMIEPDHSQIKEAHKLDGL